MIRICPRIGKTHWIPPKGKAINHSTATIAVDHTIATNSINASNDISKNFIELEDRYSAHNYHPLPVVLSRGKGVHVWDVNDKVVFDASIYYLFYIIYYF